MLQTVLLVLHIVIAIALIAIILLQQGRGATAGAAFGSGASGTVFGARGSATFLSRTTSILATVFFANCLLLAYLATQQSTPVSIARQIEQTAGAPAPRDDGTPPPPTAAAPGVNAPAAAPAQPATDVPSIPASQP